MHAFRLPLEGVDGDHNALLQSVHAALLGTRQAAVHGNNGREGRGLGGRRCRVSAAGLRWGLGGHLGRRSGSSRQWRRLLGIHHLRGSRSSLRGGHRLRGSTSSLRGGHHWLGSRSSLRWRWRGHRRYRGLHGPRTGDWNRRRRHWRGVVREPWQVLVDALLLHRDLDGGGTTSRRAGDDEGLLTTVAGVLRDHTCVLLGSCLTTLGSCLGLA